MEEANLLMRYRLVKKDGVCTVKHKNAPGKRKKEIRNFFITLLDLKWRYIILICLLGFVCSWILFGSTYYIINDIRTTSHNYSCIKHVDSFASALLFSIESQHTIGYGHRYVTSSCPDAIAVLAFQCMFGALLQACLTSLVLAKLLRPKKRRQAIIFSQNAVINYQEGNLCFCFRVADLSDHHLIETHFKLYLVKDHTTPEREHHPLTLFPMNIGLDSGSDQILLMWPCCVRHVIDSDSPLYAMVKGGIWNPGNFEIIATLEGIIQSTGMSAQAKTSYLPHEILWQHRFATMVDSNVKKRWCIDYEKFNETHPVGEKQIIPRDHPPASRILLEPLSTESDDESLCTSRMGNCWRANSFTSNSGYSLSGFGGEKEIWKSDNSSRMVGSESGIWIMEDGNTFSGFPFKL